MEQEINLFIQGKSAYDNFCDQLQKSYFLLSFEIRKKKFFDKKKILNKNNIKNNEAFKNICKNFNFLLQYSLFDIITTIAKDKIPYLEMLFIVDIGNIETRLDFFLMKKNKKFKYTYLMLSDLNITNEINKNEVIFLKKCMINFINTEQIKKKNLIFFEIINKEKETRKLFQYLAEIYMSFLKLNNYIDDKEIVLSVVSKIKKTFFDHLF